MGALRLQLLVSDATTGTHGTLRWRLRVRGNTAVEFGVVPADHYSRHGTLHKVKRPPVAWIKAASARRLISKRMTDVASQAGIR